ncbi:MAG: hypothetical protein E6R05_01710 [Candidatus Moraniibacteriota bacterium]|nr:MAG: hypothetical protein E6R05_01710 [Candidatus Moranbacteria bacterium]
MDDIRPINLGTQTNLDINKEMNSLDNTQSKENLVMQNSGKRSFLAPIMIIIGIIGGLFLGYNLAQKKLLLAGDTQVAGGSKLAQNPDNAASVKAGDIFGASDEKTFRDQVEGVLQPGGIEGEGSHHIERGANASQWVYVTSSVVDLDMFVGHKVTIWGETNSGKKAGWLMDVGRLKVQELNAAEINNIEPLK